MAPRWTGNRGVHLRARCYVSEGGSGRHRFLSRARRRSMVARVWRFARHRSPSGADRSRWQGRNRYSVNRTGAPGIYVMSHANTAVAVERLNRVETYRSPGARGRDADWGARPESADWTAGRDTARDPGLQDGSHRDDPAAGRGSAHRRHPGPGANGHWPRHRGERRAGPRGFPEPAPQRRPRQRDAGQSVSAGRARSSAPPRACRSTWTACGSTSRSATS
jgi:hypothetical protein